MQQRFHDRFSMEPGIVIVLPPCYLGQSGSYQIAAKGDKPIERRTGRSIGTKLGLASVRGLLATWNRITRSTTTRSRPGCKRGVKAGNTSVGCQR
ncbi:MAG: hypothetical protein QNI93_18700 [Kiloniellales bacterium]|nr:hypothetical protein [Kiloniellales bacterium]